MVTNLQAKRDGISFHINNASSKQTFCTILM